MNWKPYSAGAFAGLLIACGSGTNAVSGPTQAEFAALTSTVAAQAARIAALEAGAAGFATSSAVTALETRVDGLEATANAGSLFAGDGASARGGFKLADAESVGTLVALQPAGPAHKATKFEIRSPLGYLYSVGAEPLISGNHVGDHLLESATGAGVHPVYYASADCTGTAHLNRTEASRYGARQGFVFRIGAGSTGATQDDPRQYFYVAKGTEAVSSFQYQSSHSNVDTCVAGSGALSAAYPLRTNEPSVTGVPSGHIAGPLELGR